MTLKQNALLQGGKYRIVRFISSGGFGCTYEAEHVMLGERVAIKEFFVRDFCNRDEATAHVTVGTQSKKGLVDKLKHKFVEEAKMLYRMQHPGIVRVFDIFEENSTAYFVMDYIDGPSLSEIVAKEGALSEARAVRYIRQVAEALKYVHDQDRLHLDIKPGNIMVDSNDDAILIDFGASKQYDEVDGENTSTLLGKTPGYAPLEQMGNDVVKFLPATDIYALGATLYKLLTGITPLSATLLASGEELQPLPANVSESTRATIRKAMLINKNKRVQGVEEFLVLLSGESKASQVSGTTLQQLKAKRNERSSIADDEETLVIEVSSEETNEKQNSSVELVESEKNWREHFKERHPIVNLTMVLLTISAGILSLLLSYDLFHNSSFFDWYEYYIYVYFFAPISILVLIGNILLFKGKQSGFWLIALSIPVVMLPIPFIVYSFIVSSLLNYSILQNMLNWLRWGVVEIMFLLFYYAVLKIKYNGKTAWDLMSASSIWMKRLTFFTWGIYIFFFWLVITY